MNLSKTPLCTNKDGDQSIQSANNLMVIIILIIYFLNICNAELIINPGAGSYITCGLLTDCTIICDKKDSCDDSTFNVHNTNINIILSNYSSCHRCIINSFNTTFLNLTVIGERTFYHGRLFTDTTDKEISVVCQGMV